MVGSGLLVLTSGGGYVAALIIAVIFIIAVCQYSGNLKKERNKISFRESIALTELPVITLYQEEQAFNFLLDTGSNDSLISKPTSKLLKGTYSKVSHVVEGLAASSNINKICNTTLNYKDSVFEVECLVSEDITGVFNSLKKETGVQIHGVLGTKFFQKYKYVIDFKDLIAYKK